MTKLIVEITGFNELQAKIKSLGDPRDKKREILLILRNVARSTVNAAKGFAPVSRISHVARGKNIEPGNLKKSIGTITGRKGKAKDNPTIYVGPRAKGNNNGWYGHFVEEGVNVYRPGFKRKHKRGANDKYAVARTKGQYYMKRAFQATGGRVSQEMEQKTAKFLQRRIDRLSK